IHEQNSFFGKSNRFFSTFAKVIALSYKNTANIPNLYQAKSVFTGDIIRKNFERKQVSHNPDNPNIFRILVFGGSQGAAIFANLIPEAIRKLKAQNPSIQLYITQQAHLKDQPN